MTPGIELVRHPRARGLRLSLDPASGRIRLTMPRRFPAARALAWAQEQGEWIAAQRRALPVPQPFVPDATVMVDGQMLRIDWSPDAPRTPRAEGDRLCCGGPVDGLAARVERWLRSRALTVLTQETLECAARAGVTIARVGIGDPRSRWGSCSASGAIRYSWRLILAPADVRRATVAHEVAHRVHMNHSPAFHALVVELHGSDPAPAYRWLRQHGAALHWVGRAS